MGATVAALLLVQLLVPVELEMLGELRPELPADLGVMGAGWGAWRLSGARLLYPAGWQDQDVLFPGKAPEMRASLLSTPGLACKRQLIFSFLSPQVSRTRHCSHVTDGPLGEGGGADACRPRWEGPQRPFSSAA